MSELKDNNINVSDLKTTQYIDNNKEDNTKGKIDSSIEMTDSELTGDDNSCLNRLKNSINDTYDTLYNLPLLTLLITIFISVNIVLGIILNVYYSNLAFSSNNVVKKLKIWTIITGTFVPSSVLNYFFTILFWVFKADKLERSLSTTRYFINFMIDAMFTSILFLIAASLIPFYNNINYNGLLSVVICENTLICMANPNVKVKFLFLKFNAKWYPIILCLIMSVIHLGYVLDMVIGIIYAFIYFYIMRITISNESIESIEDKLYFLKHFDRFISICNVNKEDDKIKTEKTDGEITIEKLDKSERDGKYNKASTSGNNLSYINLEDEKVTTN